MLHLASRYPNRILPAVSIHPDRPDALDELERCIAAGARILKLLPNCLRIDYSTPRMRPFFERMARSDMILLSHTGGEQAVDVIDGSLAHPDLLRQPLDCGVRIIAAHGAGRSVPWDPCWTDALIALMQRHPRLLTDNSATATLNRWGTARRMLREPLLLERLLHGSDMPVPTGGMGPWMGGLLTWRQWHDARRIRNPIERDAVLKQSMGFPPETFTRLGSILGLESAPEGGFRARGAGTAAHGRRGHA